MENGQCDCRKHLTGRQCSTIQSGFFCAPLDYYKYEAEDASGHSPGDPTLPVSALLLFARSAYHVFLLQYWFQLFSSSMHPSNACEKPWKTNTCSKPFRTDSTPLTRGGRVWVRLGCTTRCPPLGDTPKTHLKWPKWLILVVMSLNYGSPEVLRKIKHSGQRLKQVHEVGLGCTTTKLWYQVGGNKILFQGPQLAPGPQVSDCCCRITCTYVAQCSWEVSRLCFLDIFWIGNVDSSCC